MNQPAFRTLRPMLETIVINRKVERLKTERRELIEQIYTDYQKQLDPPVWQFLPPACLARDAEGFQDFLNAEFTLRGDLSTAYAMSIFPAFVESWTKTQQELIAGLLPDRDRGPDAPPETFAEKMERLELAQTVVVCSDCRFKAQQGRALVGWDAICRHMRTLVGGNMHPCAAYEIEEHATATAIALVTCVGLDPATTTGEEMTRRDDRFMCGNCHSHTSRGVTGLNVYTWLECVCVVLCFPILNKASISPADCFGCPDYTYSRDPPAGTGNARVAGVAPADAHRDAVRPRARVPPPSSGVRDLGVQPVRRALLGAREAAGGC